MSDERDESPTRRLVLATGLAGAAVTALPGVAGAAGRAGRPGDRADPSKRGKAAEAGRMPVVYLPHGGGPWPFVDVGFGDKTEQDELALYLRSVAAVPKARPKAVVVVSAHWEEPVPTVMTGARPPMLYDYYGFPPESYKITWPAPGEPRLAARVRSLVEAGGFKTAADPGRGFDHGTFVPLKLAYPKADVPIVQMSLVRGLDPGQHLAMGRALAPLRDEGVYIVGSGMTYHNLRAFGAPQSVPVSETFDAWLRETVTAEAPERARRLASWASAPAARQAHPREEHLLPLMVIAGAAGDDRGAIGYAGTLMGLRVSAHHFG